MSNNKACDHTSVGVIAHDSERRILLIERTYGWAPPSRHCDCHTYPVACFEEFETKTGLKIVGAPKPLVPKNPRKYFKCQRGGEYHDWQIFEVDWRRELKPSQDKTESAKWHTIEEICELAEKNELEPVWCEFFKELKIIPGDVL